MAAETGTQTDTTEPRPSLGHVLISSMRDEGPYVLEFVAHHRAIGFDHIFIASNDCRDGTDLVLDALDAAGAISHHHSQVKEGEIPQHAAYAAMRKRFDLNRAEWLMVLDADEFLHVSLGEGRVQDLTAAAEGDVDIIATNAKCYGTTIEPMWLPGLVTEQFRKRVALKSARNGAIKSLARGLGRFKAINNHSVVGYRGEKPLKVMRADRSTFEIPPGDRIWQHLRWVEPEEARHEIACYNHYAVKSLAAFCLRQSRGRGAAPKGEINDRHTQKYFDKIAGGKITDLAFVERYGAALRTEYDRLLALPGVAEAQAEAERRYGALIDELLEDDIPLE